MPTGEVGACDRLVGPGLSRGAVSLCTRAAGPNARVAHESDWACGRSWQEAVRLRLVGTGQEPTLIRIATARCIDAHAVPE